SGKHNRRAELTERACPRHHRTAEQRGKRERNSDSDKSAQTRMPKRIRHALKFLIDTLESCACRTNIERNADKTLRQNNCGCCESDVQTEQVEIRTEDAASSEGHQQGDPSDGRR